MFPVWSNLPATHKHNYRLPGGDFKIGPAVLIEAAVIQIAAAVQQIAAVVIPIGAAVIQIGAAVIQIVT